MFLLLLCCAVTETNRIMDDSVEIVLMNAYARLSATECPERFTVVRPRKSTVADLKRFLRKNYPTKPDPNKQKLIFNGRFLGNDQILGQVFCQKVF